MDIYSIFVYCGTIMVSTLLAFFHSSENCKIIKINKTAIKLPQITIFLIILILSIVCGGRGYSVGIDTQLYLSLHIDNIMQYGIEYSKMAFIPSYLAYVISKVTTDAHFFYLLIAVITNTLTILRFKDFSNKSSFPLMIFAYTTMFFFWSFNVWRQFFAASILFYSTRYLYRNDYLKFLIGFLISLFIHSSLIIGVVFIPLYVFTYEKTDKLKKSVARNILVTSPFIILILFYFVYNYYDWRHYIDFFKLYGFSNTLGLMGIARLALIRLSWEGIKRVKDTEISVAFKSSVIGILLFSLDYIITYAGRLCYSFLLFEPILIGYNYSNSKTLSILIRMTYIVLCIYNVVVSLVGNGNGIMPYNFWGY